MAGLFEKMGLVRTEYDELPMEGQAVSYEPEKQEDTPEIDAAQVSYEDVIRSIYLQGDIDDDESIFKIKAYIDILPAEMTKSKKQASIAGILAVNNIDVATLAADGRKRVDILAAAEKSIRRENDDTISEAEQDIEHLKSMIEAAEAKIADSKKRTGEACAAIGEEIEAVKQLLDFADGIAGSEGGKS